MPTYLTADDLAELLQTLEEHAALLGEHEERLTALESAPAPAEPPEDAPD